jgi:hypothetical protein
MPRFYFVLNTGARMVPDLEGSDLPDEAAAHAEAVVIVREVMRNNRNSTLSWRLRVLDNSHQLCFELLFASVDEELQRLPSPLRETITRSAHRVATLNDDIGAVRNSLRQLRATIARTEGLPYLVASNGKRVDVGS